MFQKTKLNLEVIKRVSLTLFFCLVWHLAFAADTTPPTGSIKINNGTSSTNTINVTLNLLATDSGSGVAQMRFSNNKSTWSTPEAYNTTKVWVLASGTGTRYVYVKYKDIAGNWSKIYSDSIKLVNKAPQVGTINPSSGTSAPNQAVDFTTTYSDANGWQNIKIAYFLVNTSISGANCSFAYYDQNENKLYLRNNANSGWLGGYAPGSSSVIENSYAKLDCSKITVLGDNINLTINWNLTFKSTFIGAKNMYLYVKDDNGAYNGWTQKGTWTIQDQTDTTPPTGTIKINNDDQYTNSTSVTLTLSATDTGSGMGGGAQMQFSNDNVTYSTPEAYNTTRSWTLTSDDGTKTVYVKYKDVADNWSNPISDTIILDTTAPAISINSVPSPTNQNVTLSYTVTDNFTPFNEIQVTGDNSPYINEGSHNVTLTAKDKANNSSTSSISFTIDKTPPVVIITSPASGAVVEDSQIQLQGTVDGVAFSEPRTLIEGENTLTKTATDDAGNTGSASVTIYLYLGELIGPEGGEVISPDGKVKVTIPQGALTTSQQIRIIPIDKETLANLSPEGKTLLCVVECNPLGLNFNIPVFITYTLNQAEIPGTQVYLGLYEDGKIFLTAEPSVVPVDGYNVTFSIRHFSTYAALAGLIPQSTPIGLGVKVPLPDLLTGAFSHAIPITVPPGRKGIQPAIALSYRSSNPNSWVGLGYSLNPGYLVRSTRLGPPTYIDTQDTFYLITDAGTTELVYLVDNLYQAKVESSFAKFFKESDDSWKVVGKDGSILRLGQDSNAKETSTQGTFAWYLTKAVDTNGNYIEYHYTKDQGKSYLSRIDYTGNEMGVSPTNSIEFSLESRNDIPSSYISSAKIATAKRLKEISVRVNYDLVWRYVLEYAYSTDTNRSLLKSITQFGSDNKGLPQQRFEYQKAK